MVPMDESGHESSWKGSGLRFHRKGGESGQVFTLDMFLAITLVAIVISTSGFALKQARQRAESTMSRYSLERIANDASEVLIKTSGRPLGWENDVTTLEVLGLAEENRGKAIPNTVDSGKLGWLRYLCKTANWDPAKPEVQAVMSLFGGSENFEIKLSSTQILRMEKLDMGEKLDFKTTVFGIPLRVKAENRGEEIRVRKFKFGDEETSGEGTDFTLTLQADNIMAKLTVSGGWVEVGYRIELWDIWPRWDTETSPGVDNSFEVVVVRRSAVMRYGKSVAESARIGVGRSGLVTDNLWFEIPIGGLDAFDWFLLVRTGSGEERRESAEIFVNREVRDVYDYKFVSRPDELEAIFPEKHGGIENDLPDPPRTGEIHEGSNYLKIKVTSGNAQAWIKVYVVALPKCSDWRLTSGVSYVFPVTMEIKLWR